MENKGNKGNTRTGAAKPQFLRTRKYRFGRFSVE
jgi:hypothetical protein